MQQCRTYTYKLMELYKSRITALQQINEQTQTWLTNDSVLSMLKENEVSAGFIEQRIEEVVSANIENEYETTINNYIKDVALIQKTNEEQERRIIDLSREKSSLEHTQAEKDEDLQRQGAEQTFLQSRAESENDNYETKLQEQNNSMMERDIDLLKAIRTLKLSLEKKEHEVIDVSNSLKEYQIKYEKVYNENLVYNKNYEGVFESEAKYKIDLKSKIDEIIVLKGEKKELEMDLKISREELQREKDKQLQCKEELQTEILNRKSIEDRLAIQKSQNRLEVEEQAQSYQKIHKDVDVHYDQKIEKYQKEVKALDKNLVELKLDRDRQETDCHEKDLVIQSQESELKLKTGNLERMHEEQVNSLKESYKKDQMELQQGYEKIIENNPISTTRNFSGLNMGSSRNNPAMFVQDSSDRDKQILKNDFIQKSKHEKILFKENFDIKQKYFDQMVEIEDNYKKKMKETLEYELNRTSSVYARNLKILEEQNEKYMQKCKNYELENDKLKNAGNNMSNELSDLQLDLSEKKNRLENQQRTINELNLSNNEYGKEKYQLLQKISEIETNQSIKQLNYKTIENIKENLDKKQKDYEKTEENLKKDNFDQTNSNIKLNKENASTLMEKEDLLTKLSIIKKTADNDKAMLKQTIKNLELNLSDESSSKSKLEERLEEKISSITQSLLENQQAYTEKDTEANLQKDDLSKMKCCINKLEMDLKRRENLEEELSISRKNFLELESNYHEKIKPQNPGRVIIWKNSDLLVSSVVKQSKRVGRFMNF